jgi:predicted  nucleic acid-binding Zn-ribbon protein
MSRGEALYRLQQLDSERDTKKDRLTEIESALKDDSALREARQAAEKAGKRALKWQTKQRDLELEIESLAEKTSRSEKRLYSGKVTNPKELSDLQAEVASLKGRRQRLEDTLLEAMLEREDAEKTQDKAQAHLEEVEGIWSARQADLKAERKALHQRIKEIEEKRRAILPRVDADVLATYERLRQTKGGLAVARIEQDVCTGCRVTISPSAEWKLRQGELVYCDTCGRIVVSV